MVSFYIAHYRLLNYPEFWIVWIGGVNVRRSEDRDILILIQCGFTPAQVETLTEHGLIDKAMETLYGDMPYEVKELLGMRGC